MITSPVVLAIVVFVTMAVLLAVSAFLRYSVFHPTRPRETPAHVSAKEEKAGSVIRAWRIALACLGLLVLVFCVVSLTGIETVRQNGIVGMAEAQSRCNNEIEALRNDEMPRKVAEANTNKWLAERGLQRDMLGAGLLPAIQELGRQPLVDSPEVWRAMLSLKAYLVEQAFLANPNLVNHGVRVLVWDEKIEVDGSTTKSRSRLELQREKEDAVSFLFAPVGCGVDGCREPPEGLQVFMNGRPVMMGAPRCNLVSPDAQVPGEFCLAPASEGLETLWWMMVPLEWTQQQSGFPMATVEVVRDTHLALGKEDKVEMPPMLSMAAFDTRRFDKVDRLDVSMTFSRPLYGGQDGLHVLPVDAEGHVAASPSGQLPGASPFKCQDAAGEENPFACVVSVTDVRAPLVVGFWQRVPRDIGKRRRDAAIVRLADRAELASAEVAADTNARVTYFARCKKCTEQKVIATALKRALATQRASVQLFVDEGALTAKRDAGGLLELCALFADKGVTCRELRDPTGRVDKMFGYVFDDTIEGMRYHDDAYVSLVVDEEDGVAMTFQGPAARRRYEKDFRAIWNMKAKEIVAIK